MFKLLLTVLIQVRIYPLGQYEHGADDVLVLGSDGLWDVLSNQEAAEAVTSFLANCDPDDRHRHVPLVASSRRLNFLSTQSSLASCCLAAFVQISQHLDN